MRIWRSVIVGVLFLFSFTLANAQSIHIINFSQLVQAIENGNDVRAIIHFDNCLILDLTNTTPVTRRFEDAINQLNFTQFDSANRTQIMRRLEGATTRLNFTHFFHVKETINNELIDTVNTSMKIFIERPTGESITLFGRLSVFEDNTATLRMNFFEPVLNQQQTVIDWRCIMSNGEDNNGLVLFEFS